MKNIVLTLLLFFFANVSYSQQFTAAEVLKRALQKHTSGKILNSYSVDVTFDHIGKTPEAFRQPDFALMFIDSLAQAQPDSVRMQMQEQMKRGQQEIYQMTYNWAKSIEEHYDVDVERNRICYVKSRFDQSTGKTERERSVQSDPSKQVGSGINPVHILKWLLHPAQEVNYVGTVHFNGGEFYLLQCRAGKTWIDFHIDQKKFTLVRRVSHQTVSDGFLVKGPQPYDVIEEYKEYRDHEGFLLPTKLEMIMTRDDHTQISKITWANLNAPMADSLFVPEPRREESVKYGFREISEGLVMMDQTPSSMASRSVVYANSKSELIFLTSLDAREDFTKSKFAAIQSRFPGKSLKHIFALDTPNWMSALQPFFDERVTIHSPKGRGMFSLEELYIHNKEEGKKLAAVTKTGLSKQFDRSYETDGVMVLVLNQDTSKSQESYAVAYYLKDKQAIYVNGMPYDTEGVRKFVSEKESLLLNEIEQRHLQVRDVLFAGSFVPLAPVSMSFDVFRERVLNARKDKAVGSKPKY